MRSQIYLDNYKLCYVDDYNTAYFTNVPLSKQWGDDWDDAPYEHNAGLPYDPENIVTITFSNMVPYTRPMHEVSVQTINEGLTFWLHHDAGNGTTSYVRAGVTADEFISFILKTNGTYQIGVPKNDCVD